MLVAADALAIAATALAAAPGSDMATAVVVVMALSLMWGGEHRRPRLRLSVLSELPRLLTRLGLAPALLALYALVRHVEEWPFSFVAAMAAAVVAGRVVSYALLRTLRRRGVSRQTCLVLGSGVVATELRRALTEDRQYGLDVVTAPLPTVDDHRVPDHWVPHDDSITELIAGSGASRIILAFGPRPDTDLIEIVRQVPPSSVEIFVVPRLFELGAASGDPLTDDVRGIPLVWLRRASSRERSSRAKRAFDIAVAGLLLVAAAPALAVIALAVRLSGRGPVIFRQTRVGLGGRLFQLYKFRSMRVNDDSDVTWDVVADHRVTSVGRLLRATSLDELPQLWNVLRGDMSMVGPRPERPHFVEQFRGTYQYYDDRHRIRAGLTGWAQVNGLRGDTSIGDRVRFDNLYIEHWSMWHDIVIILRTIAAVLRPTRLEARR